VFGEIDVCVEPVLSVNQAAAHPHFIERGMIGEALDSEGNSVRQFNTALPFKTQTVHRIGHTLGEDTTQILSKLGYDDVAIEALKQARCVK